MPSKKDRVTVTLEENSSRTIDEIAGPFGVPAAVVKQLIEERLSVFPAWKVGDIRTTNIVRLWVKLPANTQSRLLRKALEILPREEAEALLAECGLNRSDL